MAARKKATSQKPVNLALQGGGAHGAFTWGVLDQLFEDGRVQIKAMSGTSAGAMNAVVAVDGLLANGPDGARAALETFWRRMSEQAKFSPIQRTPFDIWTGNWSLDRNPGYHILDATSRMFSPYQLNPFDLNPLRDLLEDCVDFERVRSCEQVQLFVSATNVETGRVKVFGCFEMSADAVMASACLPNIYQAVEIDGVPYWDGGYMGNPSLFPFNQLTNCSDIVVVQINPIERKGTPKTAQEIQNRINEISFNSSLLKELRAIDFVRRLIEEGKLSEDDYRNHRVHIIENQAELNSLGASSKLNAEWAFLVHLRDLGRETAQRWLAEHADDLGNRSTIDLRALFQGTGPGL